METIGSKVLNEILKIEKLNPKQFSESIGLKRAQPIYDILNGKVKRITTNYANKILYKYPNYSYNWLITGKGNAMTNESNTNNINISNLGDGNISNTGEIGYINSNDEKIKELEKIILEKDAIIKAKDDMIDMLIKSIKK